MTMTPIHVFKQTTDHTFVLNLQDTLDKVRATLTDTGYMNDNDRFINYSSTATIYSDSIMGRQIEQFAPLWKVLGPAKQLILTDINKKKEVDLIGIGVDWFFDRHLGVKIWMNNQDPEAATQNSGKFNPLMLTNVKPTNKNVAGYFPNVVVCEDKSVVGFSLSSWGGGGFGYSIKSQKQSIVDDLYITFAQCQDNFGNAGIRRYQAGGNTIVIEGTDELAIKSSEIIYYQKVTFTTWPVTQYESDGHTYQCDRNPPQINATNMADLVMLQGDMLMAADSGPQTINGHLVNAQQHLTVIPGNSIKPGAPSRGRASTQTFGTIYNVHEQTDPAHILGAIDVYFFVFKSHELARKVIQGTNAPNPNIWS